MNLQSPPTSTLGDRTVLITGASSGIGRAAAISVANAGGRLILSGRSSSRLQETLKALCGTGHVIEEAELSSADSTADWVKSLSTRHGSLHGIFHSAGVELIRPARLTKQEQIAEVFGSSLNAALGIARAVTQKGVVADGGSVVFMSSVAAQRGTSGMTAYSAAKAAIEGLIRSLACELAHRSIRANALAAGAVATEMHGRLLRTLGPEAVAAYEGKHLLGFGTPEDIAGSVLFLLSPASRWITGTTLVVDGGYMVR